MRNFIRRSLKYVANQHRRAAMSEALMQCKFYPFSDILWGSMLIVVLR